MELTGTINLSTGLTPQGQFYVKRTKEGKSLIRTTRNPGKFLNMLLSADEDLQYSCSCCPAKFRPGGGALVVKGDGCTDPVYACTDCIKEWRHAEFLSLMGCSPEMILVYNDRMRWL